MTACFSDEDEEDQDAVLYLPVSPDIEEPEESAWAIPPEVLNSVCKIITLGLISFIIQ